MKDERYRMKVGKWEIKEVKRNVKGVWLKCKGERWKMGGGR